jgi:hypothetical protein
MYVDVWGKCGADAKCSAARRAHCRAHSVPIPRPRQVCHGFSVDMYAPPDFEVFDNLGENLLLPPPPPPPDISIRCPSSELFIGTDAHFRQQHGVHLRVRYPLDGVAPASVALAEGGPAHFDEAMPGDLLRLLPTCELGCGTDAGSAAGQHFPFQVLDLSHTCQSARAMPCHPRVVLAVHRPAALLTSAHAQRMLHAQHVHARVRVHVHVTCAHAHAHAHVHVHAVYACNPPPPPLPKGARRRGQRVDSAARAGGVQGLLCLC